ncbi:MAG TPA: heme-copper oxidase subunit III [Gemmatimonadetes bacterium]|nr:heme-copper oxidase subunit III [Gemmatimonadota bacterium]
MTFVSGGETVEENVMTTLRATTTTWTGPGRIEREQLVQFGVWMFLATVVMLFAAFTSAYIVRRAGTDWRSIAMPSVLWLNTIVLGASSLAAEVGRRAAERSRWSAARKGFIGAVLLGVVFLGGQLAGWRALAELGVFVPTSPQASFFYMLTGVHAVHLMAGLVVLLVTLPALRAAGGPTLGAVSPGVRARLAATFWHFFGALWVYLFVLFAWF